ncbi:MAG: hypothetical protein V1809_11035 [Planctomycetota bacterium]
MMKNTRVEPTYEVACRWWTDLPDIWTPIGWKDHLFRFNVLWNGTIIAQPDLNRRTETWKGQGVQISFQPLARPEDLVRARTRPPVCLTRDDGMVRQGWNDSSTPVLWTEWAEDGFLLRQEVFGHVPGGGNIRTGIEPLFAWVRLSIHDACTELPLDKNYGFVIRINAPHFRHTMNIRGHTFEAERSGYPRKLVARSSGYSPEKGWRLLEQGGKVRLAVAPGPRCQVRFFPRAKGSREAFLYVGLPGRAGAHVDLLIPMLPTDPGTFCRELSLGRSRALAEADRYWRKIPATAARVLTPEPGVNDTIRHSLKLAEVIAEKNPADGNYSMLTGSLCYADLWATPHSMACIMLLDTMGYHSVVEKYLEIFRKEQGTVVAPGDSFRLHPGYLSSPKTLTSIDWLTDHGALLYAIAEHALLSGSREFIERWTEVIVKACEFIQYARAIRNHPGVKGILPPAVATDRGTRIQAIWNDGWNYKGLTAAVRFLRQIGHPRAVEFAAEARDYRAVFQKAFREKTAHKPRWVDSRGRKHPFTPTALFGDDPAETRHAFYLDGGPLFLVYAGLMDADDPLMRSTLLWFREGPQTKFLRHDSNCWQVPALCHEMSSCEPCYSWNVFHSHQLGDRQNFLAGMYSLFAGTVSRKTYVSCETRGGITGIVVATMLPVYLARLAVVDDQLAEGELHLLRLAPLAWLRKDRETVFDRLPTEYGPVSLRFRLSRDGRTLRVKFAPRWRARPARVVLHVPPVDGLKKVIVNGEPARATGRRIVLGEPRFCGSRL